MQKIRCLFCPSCKTVMNLTPDWRSCACGESHGRILHGSHVGIRGFAQIFEMGQFGHYIKHGAPVHAWVVRDETVITVPPHVKGVRIIREVKLNSA